MTATEIIKTLCRERWIRSFVMANYTPGRWWECDVMEVTKSNLMVEYEVKVSRGDYFADAQKERNVLDWSQGYPWRTSAMERKHDMLAARHVGGPSRFYFVVPAGLVKLEEVPEWAGLIEAHSRERTGRTYIHEIKKAPRLHKEKFPQAALDAAWKTSYYRMHTLLQRIPSPFPIEEEVAA